MISEQLSRINQIDKPIVLVGLMGVGKTTVGRCVASQLKIDFIDSDHEIERHFKMSIHDIYAKYGETVFRSCERDTIANLLSDGVIRVIATGGGAFVDPENRRFIKEKALSVWLRNDLAVLSERVSRRNDRPLLKNQDPLQLLKRMADQRYSAYEQASIIIDAEGDNPEQLASRIICALKPA